MLAAIGKTISSTIIVLFLCSAAVFFAGNLLAPGSAVTTLIGAEGATPQQRQEIERRLGLDRPLLVQYFSWVGRAARGDFGVSPISNRRASEVIAQEAPTSLELALLVLVFATLTGVPAGVVAAVWGGRRLDYFIRTVALTSLAVPIFVIGTVFLLMSSTYAPGLVSSTFTPFWTDPKANLVGLVVPTITATIPTAAQLMQMTRATMLEVLSQPYVAMAYARGISRARIYFIHALKNALPPIITFQGFLLGILLGSLFIVETVFSLPGLARGLIGSINNRDYVVLMAEVMVIAASFIAGNLVAELLVAAIDPRKRSG
jgi:peptide/nickel transport system permease protein